MDAVTLDFASPPPVITTLETSSGFDVQVLRDDLLEGGTKQRALAPYIQSLQGQGYSEFVYASPFCGFAQVALAVTARLLKFNVTLFCEAEKEEKGQLQLHAFSRRAQSMGAKIVLCKTLGEAEAQAEQYSKDEKKRHKLPLGFQHPIFLRAMQTEVEKILEHLHEKFSYSPLCLWVPVGSGTLIKAIHNATEGRIRIKGVNVKVLAQEDTRILHLSALENCEMLTAPEAFRDYAIKQPAIPSNTHYDAKLWSFIDSGARSRELWWNVAR